MHKSDFSPFFDPFMLSVDASGVVPVGVRPPRPFGARPPARRDSFGIRMANKRVVTTLRMANKNGHYGRCMENRRDVTSRAKFIKFPLNFDCPFTGQ